MAGARPTNQEGSENVRLLAARPVSSGVVWHRRRRRAACLELRQPRRLANPPRGRACYRATARCASPGAFGCPPPTVAIVIVVRALGNCDITGPRSTICSLQAPAGLSSTLKRPRMARASPIIRNVTPAACSDALCDVERDPTEPRPHSAQASAVHSDTGHGTPLVHSSRRTGHGATRPHIRTSHRPTRSVPVPRQSAEQSVSSRRAVR